MCPWSQQARSRGYARLDRKCITTRCRSLPEAIFSLKVEEGEESADLVLSSRSVFEDKFGLSILLVAGYARRVRDANCRRTWQIHRSLFRTQTIDTHQYRQGAEVIAIATCQCICTCKCHSTLPYIHNNNIIMPYAFSPYLGLQTRIPMPAS